MTYEQLQQTAFASAQVPDGFDGGTREVELSINTETSQIMIVADCGAYRSGLLACMNSVENALKAIHDNPRYGIVINEVY